METKLKMGLPLEPTQAKQRPACRGSVCRVGEVPESEG